MSSRKIQQIYQGMSQAANAPNQGAALLGQLGRRRWRPAVAAAAAAAAGGQLQQIAQSVPKPVAAHAADRLAIAARR